MCPATSSSRVCRPEPAISSTPGIGPAACGMSSVAASVTPPPAGRKLRELFFNAPYVEDHSVVLYALGFPDFVVGPEANPAERNVVGLINTVGAEIGREVLRRRGLAVKIFDLLGGKTFTDIATLVVKGTFSGVMPSGVSLYIMAEPMTVKGQPQPGTVHATKIVLVQSEDWPDVSSPETPANVSRPPSPQPS